MRDQQEVRNMRHQLFTRNLSGEWVTPSAIAALDWVCDHLVSDLELLTAVEQAEPQDDEITADDVLRSLTDVIAEGGGSNVALFLGRLRSDDVTALAAAARKLDRLCKMEAKKRDKPL
jgi:hypothetical protein